MSLAGFEHTAVRSNRFEANDIKRSVMEATISSNIAMK
jgi:hypothetical protein